MINFSRCFNDTIIKLITILTCLLGLLTSGCGIFQSVAKDSILDTLANAEESIKESENYQLMERAMPTFIILMDTLLAESPDDISLLLQAAKLHSAYGLYFAQPKDPQWATLHYKQAHAYIERAFELKYGMRPSKIPFPKLEEELGKLPEDSINYLFWLAMSWGGYINTNRDDTEAMGALPYIETILHRILKLDEYYENGMTHLCLGMFYGMSSTTGDKEKSAFHFERILTHTKRQLYTVQVTYARTFAYTFQDKELFENLVEEVIDNWEDRDSHPFNSEFTLSNAIAYQQAILLQEQIDEYFPSFDGGEDEDEEMDDL